MFFSRRSSKHHHHAHTSPPVSHNNSSNQNRNDNDKNNDNNNKIASSNTTTSTTNPRVMKYKTSDLPNDCSNNTSSNSSNNDGDNNNSNTLPISTMSLPTNRSLFPPQRIRQQHHHRRQQQQQLRRRPMMTIMLYTITTIICLSIIIGLFYNNNNHSLSSKTNPNIVPNNNHQQPSQEENQSPWLSDITVYQTDSDNVSTRDINRVRAMLSLEENDHDNENETDESSSQQQQQHHHPSHGGNGGTIHVTSHNLVSSSSQRDYLIHHGNECYPTSSSFDDGNLVLKRYDELEGFPHYQNALWHYCLLYLQGGAIIDHDTVLLRTFDDIVTEQRHYAVLRLDDDDDDEGSFIHSSSFFVLRRRYSPVALGMIRLLVETSHFELTSLELERELTSLIALDGRTASATTTSLRMGRHGNHWMLLGLKCKGVGRTEEELVCPLYNGYCCHIVTPYNDNGDSSDDIWALTKHPHAANDHDTTNTTTTNDPYISTITLETLPPPTTPTPNMFSILHSNSCLPYSRPCHKCLKSWKPDRGSCRNCQHVCPCYCAALCRITPEKKQIRYKFHVTPPRYRKDPSRLIPRLVHQTWFEEVKKEGYPNMSRLIQSWKSMTTTSGRDWEYTFYDDDASLSFLTEHFPPMVREAYESLIPGAFKADLFRYCVLFIRGGVYADMDVMLESRLDSVVEGDVGFMIPMDEPGEKVGHRMCLWNGLLAASPAHPFLARVIELVVNNIRNRFTSVDYDAMLCPNPILSVSHTVDMLFTTGPCILGAAVNDVLGRHMQTSFEEGELLPPPNKKKSSQQDDGDNSGGTTTTSTTANTKIDGRSVILRQDKNDMGAHRFTLVEGNVIVAATDMPGYEDRPEQETKHYSKTRVKAGIYGLDKLYTDEKIADEEIQIIVHR